MRPEKKYLIEEVALHLSKSSYVFLANYERITVAEVAGLRKDLAAEDAEFHVVKNSALNLAARDRQLPDLKSYLDGPTAIVVGGNNPPGVAKILAKFYKDKDKVEVKVGVLGQTTLDVNEVKTLATLPSLEILKAQLLGLLNTPAQRMAAVLNAVPVSMVQVLKAKSEKGES
ncbi:MAG: 50S ribosomal protein L10 [Opitutales bacterium]